MNKKVTNVDELPPNFPLDLSNVAFRASNGEAAWPPQIAISVTRWLGANGYAVLGTELWVVKEDGTICSLPVGSSGRPEVHGNTVERAKDEIWEAFRSRAAEETCEYLQSFDPAEICEPGELRFNITWVSEPEFRRLCSHNE